MRFEPPEDKFVFDFFPSMPSEALPYWLSGECRARMAARHWLAAAVNLVGARRSLADSEENNPPATPTSSVTIRFIRRERRKTASSHSDALFPAHRGPKSQSTCIQASCEPHSKVH